MVPLEKMSPNPLLQELLWPDRWKCTVSCVLLNITKRAQVDKVWPVLFKHAPDHHTLKQMDVKDLQEIIAPLGLKNRRSHTLKKLAEAWDLVEHGKLPGIGKYAYQSDLIFFHDDLLLDQTVEDGALVSYLSWRRNQNWKKLHP